MNTIELKYSKPKLAIICLGLGLITAVGFAVLLDGDSRGLLVIAFFGIAFIGYLRHVFGNKARIIIDKEGITDKSLGIGKILWSDIRGASLSYNRGGTKFIKLKLYNERKYLEQLSYFMRVLTIGNILVGGERINANLSFLVADEKKVLQIILERSAEHRFVDRE